MSTTDIPNKNSPTLDKTRDDSKKAGNPTVTDVPKAELEKDAKRESPAGKRDTISGKARKPASSQGSDDVAPIVKQNQNTEKPAISVVPPVYGYQGIKDITKAKDDWEVAEAKLESRYGLEFLKTKTKEERKQMVEDEYRRLHNGSLTEDMMTNHHNNEPQEYVGNKV